MLGVDLPFGHIRQLFPQIISTNTQPYVRKACHTIIPVWSLENVVLQNFVCLDQSIQNELSCYPPLVIVRSKSVMRRPF